VTRRWEARTPTDTRIARCVATVVQPDAGERIVAELEVSGISPGCDLVLVDDLILLLVNHIRAAGVGAARIDVEPQAAHLLRALAKQGFQAVRDVDPVRLAAHIRSVDEPFDDTLTSGAER
jgi:hypothetical protein